MIYFAIALGGALGAVCRFWVSSSTYAWLGTEFPYGTLLVNVSGSLVMGFLALVFAERFVMNELLRYALLVGFLGAYTTFSAFALDSLHALEQGMILKVLSYALTSVLGSILGVWMGHQFARFLLNRSIG